jgi:hypothetical protein
MASLKEQARSALAKRRFALEPWELRLYGLDDPRTTGHYIPKNTWHRAIVPQLCDTTLFKLVDNKWVFANHYGNLGLPIPRLYGLIDPIHGLDVRGRPLRTADDLLRLVRTIPGPFAIKPVEGNAGKGILLVRSVAWHGGGPEFELADDTTMSASELWSACSRTVNTKTSFIVEAYLRPSNWIRELGGGAAHSLRVVTTMTAAGEPVVELAFMRLGRAGNMVDNWTAGGLAIGLDVGSGLLGMGSNKADAGPPRIASHPDTGTVFTGEIVPDWSETLDLCRKAAELSPWMRCLGWDVVLSDEGPRIVECNPGFRIQFLQTYFGGLLALPIAEHWRELGVDLPDGSRAWRRRHRAQRKPIVAQARRFLRRS